MNLTVPELPEQQLPHIAQLNFKPFLYHSSPLTAGMESVLEDDRRTRIGRGRSIPSSRGGTRSIQSNDNHGPQGCIGAKKRTVKVFSLGHASTRVALLSPVVAATVTFEASGVRTFVLPDSKRDRACEV